VLGFGLPQPTHASDAWHPALDGVATAWMLAIVFVPLACFAFFEGWEAILQWLESEASGRRR
jgi:hypothetical protein